MNSSPSLYPLRFEPIYRQYLWGGRRFRDFLQRDLPPDEIFAESWEISDHGEDQSIVANGTLMGESLSSLIARFGDELLGSGSSVDQFPLIVKFIDGAQNLSLQVHPDDAMGATLDPPDSGKTEAWIVLDAEPGSKIYVGLQPGVTHDDFARALHGGTVTELLHSFEAQPGDCILIPAGTVHSLGEGLLIAEVQQSSDTTFRLFDWNRLGTDGKPRPLHIEQGLKAIKFNDEPARVKRRHPLAIPKAEDSTFEYYDVIPGQPANLVNCDKFLIDAVYIDDPLCLDSSGFRILIVTEGAIRIEGDPSDSFLTKGQTVLLPRGKHSIVPIEPSLLIDAQPPKRY